MTTRDFSGEEIYRVLVNAGGFAHVRTTGDHLILRWDPPADHDTEPRIVTVPLHESVSIGTLRDIAENAGASDFDESVRGSTGTGEFGLRSGVSGRAALRRPPTHDTLGRSPPLGTRGSRPTEARRLG